MEIFNSEGGKLRKKDKIPYYYNAKNKFIEVPSMTEDPEKIKEFLKFCMQISHPSISDDQYENAWLKAEENMPKILEGLEQLKAETEASGENTFKTIAYVRALKVLKSIKTPIVSGKQAVKLTGIGPGIAAAINEILKHGRLKTQEERLEETAIKQSVVQKFMKIWGVTQKEASIWFYKGYREIEDLPEDQLNDKQLIGLKYYDKIEEEFTYEKMKEISSRISELLELNVENMGLGDVRSEVEVLITGVNSGKSHLQKIVDKLTKKKLLVASDSVKPKSVDGLVEYDSKIYKIKINLVPEKDIGLFLLFSRTSKNYLDYMKEKAGITNYRLDKKGLVKLSFDNGDDVVIDTPTEETIFEELGIDYVEPDDRK